MAARRARATRANYALCLPADFKTGAERAARAAGMTLNRFINVAVAEKLSALRLGLEPSILSSPAPPASAYAAAGHMRAVAC